MTPRQLLTWANLLTLCGLVAGLAGVAKVGAPECWVALLLVSLVFDVADGNVARALGQTSPFGGNFDWHVDVCIAHGMAWSFLPTPWLWSSALVILQAVARTENRKVSGRALTTMLVVGWILGNL